MDEDIKPIKQRRRGIYLLPNLFTTAALFAGFYAIVAASGSHFEPAAIAIFVAMILDGIDGRVARLTNTQSDFGVQYDSLSDMLAFGLAPALVMYEWSLHHMGKLGWLAAFVYTAGAGLRLARFNTQVGAIDKAYFQGLPSPAAAALVAAIVWLGAQYGIDGGEVRFATFPLIILAGILMVSNVRYYSFKNLHLVGRVPFIAVSLVVVVFVFISIDPPIVLFGLALTYACSGPVLTLVSLRRRRLARMAARGRDDRDNRGQT
jgi:CDP-diacylglycerol--serine O-phosphatidyltransferase